MQPFRCLAAAALAALAATAQTPLPALRVEAIDSGTVLHVKNSAAQPLTAFLIEMVDYPGSTFTYWFDELPDGLAPGAGRPFQVANQLPGAVPDSVKMQAAIFGDGSTAGVPAKVKQLIDRRRALREVTRELVTRLSSAADKPAAIAALRQAASSAPAASRPTIARALDSLMQGSLEATLAGLRKTESALAASKPPL
jgi:hypothetical protein